MHTLKNKKILFIGPGKEFYSFHLEIIKELEVLGVEVHFFQEKPIGFFYRAIKQFSKRLLVNINKLYLNNIIKKSSKYEFDYIFVIRGEVFTENFMRKLHNLNKNSLFIMYQWDSLKNNNYETLLKYFDKCYSFDSSDCSKPGLIYLPLFYTREYENKKNKYRKVVYDLSFIGTSHADRYKIISEIGCLATEKGLKCFFHLYLPVLQYIKTKFLSKKIRKQKKLRYYALSKKKTVDCIMNSKVIIDIAQRDQNGLSMRTFEALAAGKKLMTTNKNIYNEPFYDQRVIMVFDPNNIQIDEEFVNNAAKVNINSYCISNWVKHIFQ